MKSNIFTKIEYTNYNNQRIKLLVLNIKRYNISNKIYITLNFSNFLK